MAARKTVPVFIETDGQRIQIGNASSEKDGVRTIQRFKAFENLEINDPIFGDVEETVEEKSTEAAPVEEKPATETTKR